MRVCVYFALSALSLSAPTHVDDELLLLAAARYYCFPEATLPARADWTTRGALPTERARSRDCEHSCLLLKQKPRARIHPAADVYVVRCTQYRYTRVYKQGAGAAAGAASSHGGQRRVGLCAALCTARERLNSEFWGVCGEEGDLLD